MGQAEIEAQGSSHGGSVNPYWPALHMKFLAEDMDKMTEDLDKLAAAIGKRKIIGCSADSYEGGGQQQDTAKLAESARELQEVHQHLEQYIEREFGHWAHEHDIRILDTFFEKNLSRKRYVHFSLFMWTTRCKGIHLFILKPQSLPSTEKLQLARK
jgi:hypothetical protein